MFHYVLPTIAVAFLVTGPDGSIANQQRNKQIKRISVDLYYETLCPYSVLFVVKQLVPAYDQLKDFITVNFVPFGKASYVPGSSPTKFTCQHGPAECHGNKAQACALYEIDRSVKVDKQQQKSIDIVGCVMESKNPSASVPECAKEIDLSKESIASIKNCIRSTLGDDLLIAYGKKTEAFESPLLGVPSITINGVKNKEAISNFIGEICQLIPASNKPNVCGQSLNIKM